jgi:hypothetical protein
MAAAPPRATLAEHLRKQRACPWKYSFTVGEHKQFTIPALSFEEHWASTLEVVESGLE